MFICKKLKITKDSSPIVDIGFQIEHSLALIGESGSGKSLSLKALLNLLPGSLQREFEYEAGFELERGVSLSFVPQNPFTALSPLTKIKNQMFCENADRRLKSVGLDERFLERFPPELSGGQLQRVLIAMSLSEDTKLLLLDEPTTALDTKTKEGIITLLKDLQNKFGFLMLFVSHDVNSAKKLCKEVAVIKKGNIVESALMDDFIQKPKTEYAKALIEANFAYRDFRE
ncbi:MAG: ATP-binding cassette domain-containing protein [Campylobacterales bacterium]